MRLLLALAIWGGGEDWPTPRPREIPNIGHRDEAWIAHQVNLERLAQERAKTRLMESRALWTDHNIFIYW